MIENFFYFIFYPEPQEPELGDLLQANSSCINLNLSSWNNGGCPILHFSIEHRPLGKFLKMHLKFGIPRIIFDLKIEFFFFHN